MFTTQLLTRVVVFLVVALVVGAIVFAGMALAYRTRPVFVPATGPNDPVARYRTTVMTRLRLIAILIPLVVGVFAGLIAQGYWVRVQLFLHGGSFGVTDPQFGKDLGFYAFDLPFYRMVMYVMFGAVFVAFIANLLGHYIFGGVRLTGRSGALSRAARIQLVVLVGVLVLLKVFAYWLDRYELLSHTRGGKPFTGAGYTDINAVLPAKLILMAIALICAVAVFSALVLRDLRIPAIGLVLLVLSSLIVGAAWPWWSSSSASNPMPRRRKPSTSSAASSRPRQAYGLTEQIGDATATGAATRPRRRSRSRRTAPRPPTSGCSTRRSSARRSRSSSRARTSTASPTSCPSTATPGATAVCATSSSRPANSTPTG